MIGERVRAARESSGWTQKALSEACGISTGKLSKVESGMAMPTPEDIAAFSAALQFPESFFTEDKPLYQAPEGRFRKRSRATASSLKQLSAQARLLADVMDQGCRLLNVRRVLLRPWERELDPESIRECARTVRAQAGIGATGAVPNVTRACERLGVPVAVAPPLGRDRDLSGYSVWGDLGDARPLITVTAGQSGDVQRATIAHELGHLALHTLNQHVEGAEAEEQAWLFASEFLVPEEDLLRAFEWSAPTLGDLLRLKGVYGVSVSFLIMACARSGVIDESRKRSLYKQRSARGWTKSEPGEVGSERPTIVPSVLSELRGRGVPVGLQAFLAGTLAGSGKAQAAPDGSAPLVSFARA